MWFLNGLWKQAWIHKGCDVRREFKTCTFFHTFPTSLLGKVGKTSLSMRFVKNSFNSQEKSTVNAYYLEKTVQVDNYGSFKLALWVNNIAPLAPCKWFIFKDTAGQEEFNAMMPMYYRGAEGLY